MDFVSYGDVAGHEGLQRAFELNKVLAEKDASRESSNLKETKS
jgi:hypothetical protein